MREYRYPFVPPVTNPHIIILNWGGEKWVLAANRDQRSKPLVAIQFGDFTFFRVRDHLDFAKMYYNSNCAKIDIDKIMGVGEKFFSTDVEFPKKKVYSVEMCPSVDLGNSMDDFDEAHVETVPVDEKRSFSIDTVKRYLVQAQMDSGIAVKIRILNSDRVAFDFEDGLAAQSIPFISALKSVVVDDSEFSFVLDSGSLQDTAWFKSVKISRKIVVYGGETYGKKISYVAEIKRL